MSFIIRQVTRRPAGQDIIRDRTVEANRLSVGRATANDLFLSDLRVGLSHLTLQRVGSRLALKGAPDKDFLYDGKVVRQATLSGNRPETVQVGPYALTIGPQGPAWMVQVERTEPEEVLNPDDVDQLFTLRGTMISRRVPSWLSILVVGGLFLALPIAWFYGNVPDQANAAFDADRAWLSGPLSGAHGNLEAECESCHVNAFEHVTDGTCLDCHEGLGNHAVPARLATAMPEKSGPNLWVTSTAAFFGKEDGQCADCHREHNGDDGVILQASSTCTDCHADMSTRLTDTPLGNAGDFGLAHPNFHAVLVATPGATPTFRRVSLDAEDLADNAGLKFPHDLHLETSGAVAQQAQRLSATEGFGDALVCEDCHSAERSGIGFAPVSMQENCQMCHSLAFDAEGGVERRLPHGQPAEVINVLREYSRARAVDQVQTPLNLNRRRPGQAPALRQADRAETAVVNADKDANALITAVFSEGGACYDCHEVVAPPAGTVDYDIVPVHLVDVFMPKAEFDHSKHEVGDLTCESCHAASGSESARDVLLPGIDQTISPLTGDVVAGCRDCHGGEDAGGDLVASNCLTCHGYHDAPHAPVMTATTGHRRRPGEALGFDPMRWGQ